MRRDEIEADQMPGQDSFLDVITNIVGILILLVLVVGVRTSRAVIADAGAGAQPAVSEESLQAAVRTAVSTQHDVEKLVRRADDVHREVLLKDRERQFLGTYIASGEQELADERKLLSDEQQRDFDLRQKLTGAQQTLDQLTREQMAVLTQTPTEIEEVRSLPTPLAETVTGKEIHLRLSEGHVSVIPLDDLLKDFRTHADQNMWRLREQDELVSKVGPIDGFQLRYILAKHQFTARSQAGLEQHGSAIRLVRWELLPMMPQLGETIDQAVAPQSDLRRRLQRSSPEATTITVWTYPDSFAEFRKLKKSLYEMGYTTAARPLPIGIPIGGSPEGTRSAAQ